jgi:hypothetical protein
VTVRSSLLKQSRPKQKRILRRDLPACQPLSALCLEETLVSVISITTASSRHLTALALKTSNRRNFKYDPSKTQVLHYCNCASITPVYDLVRMNSKRRGPAFWPGLVNR